MFLIDNKALVARCSSEILFFKLKFDQKKGGYVWSRYHTLEHRGFINYIKGNNGIKIITDDKIFFYKYDPESFIPYFENVMFNYMKAAQLITPGNLYFSYQLNGSTFETWSKKYSHSFIGNVDKSDLGSSVALPMQKTNSFIFSD
jgi:hypothetical protein